MWTTSRFDPRFFLPRAQSDLAKSILYVDPNSCTPYADACRVAKYPHTHAVLRERPRRHAAAVRQRRIPRHRRVRHRLCYRRKTSCTLAEAEKHVVINLINRFACADNTVCAILGAPCAFRLSSAAAFRCNPRQIHDRRICVKTAARQGGVMDDADTGRQPEPEAAVPVVEVFVDDDALHDPALNTIERGGMFV